MEPFDDEVGQSDPGLTRLDLLRRGALLAAGGTLVGAAAPNALGARLARAVGGKDLELWAWQPPGNGYPETFAYTGARWEKLKSSGAYKYTQVEFNSYFTKFKTAAAGGNPPDLMEMSWTGQYHDLIRAGTLRQLDDVLASKLFPKFFPSVMESLKYKGKTYAIPLDLNTLSIGYNKDIFKKLGLKPPQTFDQLLALAKPLRAAGYQPLAIAIKDAWPTGDVWFAQVAYTDKTGKAIRQAETKQVAWDDKRFLAAAQRAQQLQKSGLLADGAESLGFTDMMALFSRGRAAMGYPIGNFNMGLVDKISGGEFNLGIFPFPPFSAKDKVIATGGPAIIFSVPSKAKNPHGAINYMRLATDGFGRGDLVKRNFIPSSRTNASANTNAIYRQMVSIQPTAATRAIFVPEVYTALLNSMQALLSGKASPQQVVKNLKQAAKK